MTSREGLRSLRPAPRLRGGLLALLVLLLSCGVVAMHSLGAGHSAMAAAAVHDLDRTMSTHPVVGLSPTAHLEAHESGPAPVASIADAGQGCAPCAVEAANIPDQTTDHGGMAMCLAVLSLLVWVVLRRQRRPFRTVRTLGDAGRRAFSELVRGPPRYRTPSLSELCICRT